MFRLVACLALLLVFCLPAAAQEPPEAGVYISFSRLFPTGVTVPLPLAPDYVQFKGICGISYNTGGLASWGLVSGGLYIGPQNIAFNPTFFIMTHICNDKAVFRRSFIICDGPCPRKTRIHIRTKADGMGTRG